MEEGQDVSSVTLEMRGHPSLPELGRRQGPLQMSLVERGDRWREKYLNGASFLKVQLQSSDQSACARRMSWFLEEGRSREGGMRGGRRGEE